MPSKLKTDSADSLCDQITTRTNVSAKTLKKNRFNYEGLKIYISGCAAWNKEEFTKVFDHIRECKGQATSVLDQGQNSSKVNLVVVEETS